MGTVWHAVDEILPRQVAIKFGEAASDASALRQNAVILAEATNGARLVGHRNVVPILDYGIHPTDGTSVPFLVMDYAPGPTLASFLESLDRLTDKATRNFVALHLVREICEALIYSHEQGILHRDIKPTNCLLTGGVLRVSDFGLSRKLGEPTRDQTVREWVSPHYAAPEQYDMSVNPTRATDTYQVAATAYEVITGRTVFPNDRNVREYHVNRTPQPIKDGFSDWQFPEVAELVLGMLRKDPFYRPELWELHDELCLILHRPWRLVVRDVYEHQRVDVARILGFDPASLDAGVNHIYADERLAFRHFISLMEHNCFVGRLEGQEARRLGG